MQSANKIDFMERQHSIALMIFL